MWFGISTHYTENALGTGSLRDELVDEKAVCLLHFANLIQDGLSDGTAETNQAGGGEVRAAIVTVLAHCTAKRSSDGAVYSYYKPAFWDDVDVVKACINLLTTDVVESAYTMYGTYPLPELAKLDVPYLITKQAKGGIAMHMVTPRFIPHFTLLHAPSGVDEIVASLPSTVALGHGEETVIMVSPAGEEPPFTEMMAVYNGEQIVKNARYDLPRWCNRIPTGVRGYLSDYGGEDGNHALIGHRDIAPEVLARRLAEALSLPYVQTNAGQRDFWKWDGDHILPSDIKV